MCITLSCLMRETSRHVEDSIGFRKVKIGGGGQIPSLISRNVTVHKPGMCQLKNQSHSLNGLLPAVRTELSKGSQGQVVSKWAGN